MGDYWEQKLEQYLRCVPWSFSQVIYTSWFLSNVVGIPPSDVTCEMVNLCKYLFRYKNDEGKFLFLSSILLFSFCLYKYLPSLIFSISINIKLDLLWHKGATLPTSHFIKTTHDSRNIYNAIFLFYFQIYTWWWPEIRNLISVCRSIQ